MDIQTTSPKPFCFVLMPFEKKFDDVYEFGIKGACEDAGVYCDRVDEQIFAGSMLDRIYNQISKADIIVADMTGRNPNVFYEVGYAHVLGKTVILLTQQSEDIPFDLKHFQHIVYNAQIKELRADLAKRVKHFAFDSGLKICSEIGLEIFYKSEPLTSGTVMVKHSQKKYPKAELTIYNSSSKAYLPGDFRVGIITPPSFYNASDRDSIRASNVSSARLPTGQYLHVLPKFETLFPGAYCSAFFVLTGAPDCPIEFDLILRIFTSVGYRDFPLSMVAEPK